MIKKTHLLRFLSVYVYIYHMSYVIDCIDAYFVGMILEKKIRSLEKKITFPGKNIYSPWKRNLGSCGPLVLWSSGPVVLWSCGPVVLWSCGPLVLWSPGKGMKRNM